MVIESAKNSNEASDALMSVFMINHTGNHFQMLFEFSTFWAAYASV